MLPGARNLVYPSRFPFPWYKNPEDVVNQKVTSKLRTERNRRCLIHLLATPCASRSSPGLPQGVAAGSQFRTAGLSAYFVRIPTRSRPNTEHSHPPPPFSSRVPTLSTYIRTLKPFIVCFPVGAQDPILQTWVGAIPLYSCSSVNWVKG